MTNTTCIYSVHYEYNVLRKIEDNKLRHSKDKIRI